MNNEDRQNGQRIKIYVATRTRVAVPQCDAISLLQVGTAQAPEKLPHMLHDDSGDSISSLNAMYCELTAQYWAWKNADADYYGFCHYRRYFDFSGVPHQANDYGEIMVDFIDEAAARRYGLDDESIKRQVIGWDVITSPVNNVKAMGGYHSLIQHYAGNDHLRVGDLRLMYEILCKNYPDYREDADAVLHGDKGSFCNMFIMKKEIFRQYCQWLFPLLQKFTALWDASTADIERLRTPGHLAERLLNIFLCHHQRTSGNWKIKQLGCVHFRYPDAQETAQPASATDKAVPVVLAANNAYVPMLATTLTSILRNSSANRRYRIIVLEQDISKDNQEILAGIFAKYSCCSLHFLDVRQRMASRALTTNNGFISNETYYRFLIQEVLPQYDKVVYLDSDLVVNRDIAELYDTDVSQYAVAAVKDLDFLGNLGYSDGKRLQYARNVLHLKHPYTYFQAGVLVMNLKALRRIHTTNEWMRLAANPHYIYNDQDILNMECQGKVRFLDGRWNVLHDCNDRVETVFRYAPAQAFKEYAQAREEPYIVHYAGFDKPWLDPWCDLSTWYWLYVRQSPLFHQILAIMTKTGSLSTGHHKRLITEDSPLRQYADKILPIGSKRRSRVKSLLRVILHKA